MCSDIYGYFPSRPAGFLLSRAPPAAAPFKIQLSRPRQLTPRMAVPPYLQSTRTNTSRYTTSRHPPGCLCKESEQSDAGSRRGTNDGEEGLDQLGTERNRTTSSQFTLSLSLAG